MFKKLNRLDISKRHFAKALTWRIIGSLDTFVLSWIITEDILNGVKISVFESLTKTILYYFHERFWFRSKIKNANKRHLIKTFSWRIIGTFDSFLLMAIISGNPFFGIQLGTFETFSKMILYYFHERIWYGSKYGLENEIRK